MDKKRFCFLLCLGGRGFAPLAVFRPRWLILASSQTVLLRRERDEEESDKDMSKEQGARAPHGHPLLPCSYSNLPATPCRLLSPSSPSPIFYLVYSASFSSSFYPFAACAIHVSPTLSHHPQSKQVQVHLCPFLFFPCHCATYYSLPSPRRPATPTHLCTASTVPTWASRFN